MDYSHSIRKSEKLEDQMAIIIVQAEPRKLRIVSGVASPAFTSFQSICNSVGFIWAEVIFESMRDLLKQINARPRKLVLEVYELVDFKRGSQKNPDWLSDMDSNHE